MAKLAKQLKLQIDAGKAVPAPPLGPALGQAGVNIGEFVNQFNAATQDQIGSKVSVIINVYEDRSFDFIVKTPLAAKLIMKRNITDKNIILVVFPFVTGFEIFFIISSFLICFHRFI